MPAGPDRICSVCRRDQVITQVRKVETSLSTEDMAAAVDAVATNHAVWRSLAVALQPDPDALIHGAPPAVGRLVTELIARGSTTVTTPTCVVCGRAGRPLMATHDGGMCTRCAHRAHPAECVRCGMVKPVAGRIAEGQPICERCRRWERGRRECGRCNKIASIAVQARDGQPDICVNCYRMPHAVCSVCGRNRECNFATGDAPICVTCSPRATATCARCGHDRPPAARWDEGPVCDPCYTAALRHRGRCAACGNQRRLVAPPGPAATTCADCAGVAVTHACSDCGLEDKLYEKDRCARCSLRRRATHLLACGAEQVPVLLELPCAECGEPRQIQCAKEAGGEFGANPNDGDEGVLGGCLPVVVLVVAAEMQDQVGAVVQALYRYREGREGSAVRTNRRSRPSRRGRSDSVSWSAGSGAGRKLTQTGPASP
jgi:hypothetical protein